jgi:dTDP-4-amino-4,6-dideoxygalactose transaminase
MPGPHGGKSAADLAFFGGPPLFDEPLHVGRPHVGNRRELQRRIDLILDDRRLTNDGPFVREFEARIAELTGVEHCIAMSNGTMALELVIEALGLTGEVLTTSFTFIATAHALQRQRARPVFCDIDPRTHVLDPEEVERRITPRTSGILGVHVWGEPCAIDELSAIARRHRLKLLFDASHALGCGHGGQMIGSFGDAEVFSFHATKTLNTFEGGAVTTNDRALAEKLRLTRNFGFDGYDSVACLGTNAKMPEIAAAMGVTNLESLDEFVAANRTNYLAYREGIEPISCARLFPFPEAAPHNFHYIVVEWEHPLIDRDLLVKLLAAENVLARRYFYPGCHRLEPHRSSMPDDGHRLPATEALCRRVVLLPCGGELRPEEIDSICGLLRVIATEGEEILGRHTRTSPAHA